MIRNTKGFTLIELLIVVVIIGILAAIAIPKFSATREKAYFSAMKSDLKNLQAAQEIYYSASTAGVTNYTYTNDLALLEFTESSGVTIAFGAANATGWSATATHDALDAGTQTCAVFVGDAAAAAPATNPGVVTCQGET
jgi:type IV pilus assembly protein PilA